MRDYRNAKTMAAELRAALAARSHALTHGEALELVASLFGARDWNTLAAAIGDAEKAEADSAKMPTRQTDWRTLMRPYYDRHLTPEDRGRAQENISSRWSRIFAEAQALHDSGADPVSPAIVEVATRWLSLANLFSGGDAELSGKYLAAYRDGLSDPEVAAHLPICGELLDWLQPAFSVAGEALRAKRAAA